MPYKHCVYGLTDPKDGEVIYIGYTSNPSKRRHAHKYHLKKKTHWNRQLQNVYDARQRDGMDLKFITLVKGSRNRMMAAEVGYIAEAKKKIGKRLCNVHLSGVYDNSYLKKAYDTMATKRKMRKCWSDLHQAMYEVVSVCKIQLNDIHRYGCDWATKPVEDKLLMSVFGKIKNDIPYPEVEEYRREIMATVNRPKYGRD